MRLDTVWCYILASRRGGILIQIQLHHALPLTDVVTDAVLDTAYVWLCQRRRDWPAKADVWRFRQDWPENKATLRADLLAGTYEVELLSCVTL